jgi:hypothetical protein
MGTNLREGEVEADKITYGLPPVRHIFEIKKIIAIA